MGIVINSKGKLDDEINERIEKWKDYSIVVNQVSWVKK